MGRVMYFEGFSGAAGDMILGALLDAGLPLDALRAALGSLGVAHDLRVNRVVRCGVTATKFDVLPLPAGTDAAMAAPRPGIVHGHGGGDAHVPQHSHGHDAPGGHAHPHEHGHSHHEHAAHEGHRSLREISHLIDHSALSVEARARAIRLFRRLAEAEAAIHGLSVDEVHLHEVGALDSIIDIVGTVFALEYFGVDDIESSPLNVGSGKVKIAHGTFPVPAPATLALLRGVPIYSDGAGEMVTPTGALLLSDYARWFGPMPAMRIDRIGYGAGTRDTPDAPNVLRVVVGERIAAGAEASSDTMLELSCEIDDMSPQLYGPATEQLFAAGAVDVFLTPVFMKKGRPGTLVTVLVPEHRREAVLQVVFRETTTIGVRWRPVDRETLERRWDEVQVEGGTVRVKIASRQGEILNAAAEFEDCVRVARVSGRPVKAVQAEVMRAWEQRGR